MVSGWGCDGRQLKSAMVASAAAPVSKVFFFIWVGFDERCKVGQTLFERCIDSTERLKDIIEGGGEVCCLLALLAVVF